MITLQVQCSALRDSDCITQRLPSAIYNNNNNNNNNDNNDLLTDPLGGSSLLNYIDYNYKINRIKIFTNYTVELQ